MLTTVEIEAAVARLLRGGRITEDAAEQVLARYEDDYRSGRFQLLSVNDELLSFSSEIAKSYGLRAADSIHFANAIAIQQNLSSPVFLVTSDREMIQAAILEDGMVPLDPTTEGIESTIRQLIN